MTVGRIKQNTEQNTEPDRFIWYERNISYSKKKTATQISQIFLDLEIFQKEREIFLIFEPPTRKRMGNNCGCK